MGAAGAEGDRAVGDVQRTVNFLDTQPGGPRPVIRRRDEACATAAPGVVSRVHSHTGDDMHRSVAALGLAALVGGAGTAGRQSAAAEGTGSAFEDRLLVVGTVRDGSAGGRPLEGATVVVAGTAGVRDAGATTGADGRYRVVVSRDAARRDGKLEVVARRIGFAPAKRELRVPAGSDSAVLDFALARSPLALGAVVVTGEHPAAADRTGRVLERRRADAPSARAAEASGAGRGRVRGFAAADTVDGADQGAPAGVLTAAVWDDFDDEHWPAYARFLRRASGERWDAGWGLDPSRVARVAVRLGGVALSDHPVLVEQGRARFTVRTRADGVLRLVPGAEHRIAEGPVRLTPVGGTPQTVTLSLRPTGERRERPLSIDGASREVAVAVAAARRGDRPVLDLGFLIDATGSMGDEMAYLQAELRDIVRRVQSANGDLVIRISVVYYRDRGDEFVTRVLPFGTDVDETVRFLGATRADGGGDAPEEMNAGLERMMAQRWSDGHAARMLVVLADAPPHEYADAQYTYHDAIRDAAAKGISIFPVAASGIDTRTEYLFRALAVATGGKYVFLTDDSGVGNPHLKPEIEGYRVEPLNALLVREIRAFAAGYFPQPTPAVAASGR